MKLSGFVGLFLVFLVTPLAIAQATDKTQYGRRQTFAGFFDYSNDSSHIALGQAPNRKFTEVGFQYEYRLIVSRRFVWKYTAELRPLIAESDPTETLIATIISPPPIMTYTSTGVALRCVAGMTSLSSTDPATGILHSSTFTTTCGRRWTYAEGLSPIGTRINLRPRSRWQPTGSLLAGLLLSAKKIPVETAGSFNFTFELGAGLEYFRTPTQSIRLEYQLQHFSNAYTAVTNPGVDNGLFKLTYTFGR
jgi:Lipid A 3-O-deacylase (PagL)